jgi:hypothetical protein
MAPSLAVRFRPDPKSVFLNIPYDPRYERLYLAFIAGISAFGLDPRATLEIPGGARRLDRIFELIQACRYSLHDLSRVQLDRTPPKTPRFNMPFELGLAVAWAKLSRPGLHTWFLFESQDRRLDKSLSDLRGTDPNVHGGTVKGLFRELGNAFVTSRHQPTVGQMQAVYRDLRQKAPRIVQDTGARSLFEAGVFRRLVVLARISARQQIPSLKSLPRRPDHTKRARIC